ncbi:MAG: pre-peptidase C-terminal domain-containing protein [Microcoleaceae cyanobacterium]
MVQVSLSTSTTFDGNENALIENQDTSLTVNFDLDQPAPTDGLQVFVDGDVEQILNRLDLPGFLFNPITENIAFNSFLPNRDSSGFALTIDEAARDASFTIDVFDNIEPDTFLPDTFDGLVETTFSLLTEEQVDRDIEGPIPELSDYTVNPNAANSVVLFADTESQLNNEPPTPPSDALQVSLFTGPDYLIEDEATVSAHAFLATNGVIPDGGLVVSVNAPNLSEFDLSGVSVEGGTIEAVGDGGFDLRMTQYTTLVNLAIAEDGETEAGETATFSLATADEYEIVEDYSSGTFNLVDTRSDIPRGVITEPNDIVTVATDTQITPESPSFTSTESSFIYFDIGNRYLNPDGTYTYIDTNEDVDLYQVELNAGQTIAIETFDFETNPAVSFEGNILDLSVYSASGEFQALTTGLNAAPDKLFEGTDPVLRNQTDSYLEFTASEAGTYYVAVSIFTSGGTGGDPDLFLDIDKPGEGSGLPIYFGEYDIAIDLITEDNPRNTAPPTPPVSNPNVIDPPTLSLSANPATSDADGNFFSAVVESVETGGRSEVSFTIRADGEVPEEGLDFILESNANLFDYVSVFGQFFLPSTLGGQSLGAYYDEDGVPTGIRLRLEDPTMTVSLESANPLPFIPEYLIDTFEGLETDGEETVTFSLQPGDGFEIAEETGTVDVTYFDSLADVPPPGDGEVIPELSISISETELIETEETETTFTFTLSEPPPPEGLTIAVTSEDEVIVGSALSQFDVLNAEIEGGNFPFPNSEETGFFFTITEQTASITLSVFNELTVPNLDPLTVQEGILGLTFELQPQRGYTIDETASSVSLTIADNPDSQIQVSLIGEPETLVEEEETVSIHTFSLSAPPPSEGITVSVNADSLDDFALDQIQVSGGEITGVSDDGFDLLITERQAIIELPVADDGVTEGNETATFTIEPGDTYEINQAAETVEFNLVDVLTQATNPEETEGNSTLPEANSLGLSTENPNVTISGRLAGSSDSFPGSFSDFSEDVDFYAFNLEAGQTVTLDIDSETFLAPEVYGTVLFPALEEISQQPDSELRLFDGLGNELAANNDGAAPDEEFSRDPFIEYTATESGTYYVAVSQLGNSNYDPFTIRSGSGWTFPEVGVFYGPYDLTATLTDSIDPEIIGTDDSETLDGNEADNLVAGLLGDDTLFGNSGDDTLRGDLNSRDPGGTVGGDDVISGGAGNDQIGGKGGNDLLSGDEGDDEIWGDDGNDTIMGGAGNDTLTGDDFSGGSGSDLFVFKNGDGTDTITDFDPTQDMIGLVEGELMFEDIEIIEIDGNAAISVMPTGETIAVLDGVDASEITQELFLITPDVTFG